MRGSGGVFLVMLMCMFVIVLAAIGYFAYDKYYKKDAPNAGAGGSPDAGTKGSPGELVITEDGASMTESYRIMPRREKYILMPSVEKCYEEQGADYCAAYDKNDNKGFAYVYDLSFKDAKSPSYNECPGGGHDCWYIEKYDNEGTMIGVANKNGESMLDILADDIWGGKWDMENNELVKAVKKDMEFKDGKLIAKNAISSSVGAGDTIKPTDLPSSLFFTALFTAMKLAGEEKPTKITVNIKNAKDIFDKIKNNKTRERISAPQPSDEGPRDEGPRDEITRTEKGEGRLPDS